MTKTIKIYDGVIVRTDGKEQRFDYIPDIWEAFRWDIENNEEQKNASLEITRALIGFGYVDLTFAMPKGHTMEIEIIPPTND